MLRPSTPNGLLLSKHKYIREILDRFGMSEVKDTSTPMANSVKLQLKDGSGSKDIIEFRQAIGALQYLSLTRPDLAFSVNNFA